MTKKWGKSLLIITFSKRFQKCRYITMVEPTVTMDNAALATHAQLDFDISSPCDPQSLTPELAPPLASADSVASTTKAKDMTTTMTELASEAIAMLSSVVAEEEETEAVMIRTEDKDGQVVEGVVEMAARKVVVVRTDVLEPAESWIRAWMPIRWFSSSRAEPDWSEC